MGGAEMGGVAAEARTRPSPAPAPSPAAHYRPQLDGLRAVAVYLVVAYHAGIHGFSGGFIGVDLFFVLSGYLVTQLLLRDFRQSERIGFRRFYARRMRRLLPAAFATLIVTAVVYTAVAAPAEVLAARGGFRSAFLYVANWHFIAQSNDYFAADVNSNPVVHFWSLAVEEQFYLLWPLAVWLLSNRGVLRATGAMILLAPVCRYLLHLLGFPQTALYEFTISRVDALGAGAALAVVMRDPVLRALLIRWWRWLALIAAALLIVFAGVNHGFHSDEFPVQLFGQSLLVGVCAALLLAGLDPGATTPPALKRLLVHPALRLLGKYSYAMYVIHFALLTVAAHYLIDAVNSGSTAVRVLRLTAYLTAILFGSLFMAMASWWLMESRFLALKDRWAPRPAAA